MFSSYLAAWAAAFAFLVLFGSAARADEAPLLYARTGAPFEEICDANHYLVSPTGGLTAAFGAGIVGVRGPFAGSVYEAAFAPSDCLSGPCAGWVKVSAMAPITGVSLDETSMTVRLHGGGVFRVGLDGKVAQIATVADDPCRAAGYYVGGCARLMVNDGAPEAALRSTFEGPSRRVFGYAEAVAGPTASRRIHCDAPELCGLWPTPIEVALIASAGTTLPLAKGRLLLTRTEREQACRDQGPDCPTGEFVPLLDGRTSAYVAPMSAEMLKTGRHADVVSFAFRVPGGVLLGVGDGVDTRRVVLTSAAGQVSRACPRRLPTLPAGWSVKVFTPPSARAERRRVMAGSVERPLSLFIDRPQVPARGTLVYFDGGPGGAPEFGQGAVDVTAVNLGAVVVRAGVAGQDGLSDGAWQRLAAGGRDALDADLAALEDELADQARYPRPLILAGDSFGALPLRVALERGRLKPDHVILSVPMTAYRSPADMVRADEARMGRPYPDGLRPRIEASVARSQLTHDRVFGPELAAGRPFRTWMDAFDACLLPPGSRVYLAQADDRVAWTPPTACAGPTVVTLPGSHDLALGGADYWAEIEKVLPAMLRAP